MLRPEFGVPRLIEPLSDVCGTIFQPDAVGLAAAKKFNSVSVDQGYVFQIKSQLFFRCLRGKQLSQLIDFLYLDSSTEREDNSPISCFVNSQHVSFYACGDFASLPTLCSQRSRVRRNTILRIGSLASGRQSHNDDFCLAAAPYSSPNRPPRVDAIRNPK